MFDQLSIPKLKEKIFEKKTKKLIVYFSNMKNILIFRFLGEYWNDKIENIEVGRARLV